MPCRSTPATIPAGTAISNQTNNARRVRFVLQGNDAIGDADADGDAADGDTAGVHTLLIWRDSVSTEPASPANIVMRRGIKNTNLMAAFQRASAPPTLTRRSR